MREATYLILTNVLSTHASTIDKFYLAHEIDQVNLLRFLTSKGSQPLCFSNDEMVGTGPQCTVG